jgi:hypothetical protein
VRSYRTFSPLPQAACGSTEVNHQLEAVHSLLHLPSRWLEPSVPDVIRHTALRSSDFPPPPNALRPERQRSSSRLHPKCIPPVVWVFGQVSVRDRRSCRKPRLSRTQLRGCNSAPRSGYAGYGPVKQIGRYSEVRPTEFTCALVRITIQSAGSSVFRSAKTLETWPNGNDSSPAKKRTRS